MTQFLRFLVFGFCLLVVSAHAADDSPLHEAVKKGDKAAVEVLLAKGVDVNAKGKYGLTPLHVAAFFGPKDVVDLLLAKGADINAKSEAGETPLLWAANSQTKGIVELLEEHFLRQARHDPRAALVQLTAQLKDKASDTGTRRLIIKLAGEIKPPSAIPEEARKHFIEGEAIYKLAKNPAQAAMAAQSFTEALKVAPWWGDAYYNLGAAQELAEKYDQAEQAFNFYLLSNPSETEKRETQDRIYALGAKRRLLGAK